MICEEGEEGKVNGHNDNDEDDGMDARATDGEEVNDGEEDDDEDENKDDEIGEFPDDLPRATHSYKNDFPEEEKCQ